MHILFVCTDNGLGHLHRSLNVAKSFKKNNIDISFIAPRLSWLKLKSIEKFNHFDLSISPNTYYFDYINLEEKILSLLTVIPKVNLIVFDNLPFYRIACEYPSILFANFYWHCVLPNFRNTLGSQNFINCLKVIKFYAATSLFCMPHIEEHTHPYMTNPFSAINHLLPKQNNNSNHSILISIGLSDRYSIDLSTISLFCQLNIASTVFIEPRLFSSFQGREPPNCQIAGYSANSYSIYDLAIVRPGLGTVLDLVRYNIPSITVYEPENLEMRHNAYILSNLSPQNKNYQSFPSNLLNKEITINSECHLSQLQAYNQLSSVVITYPSLLEDLIHEI